MDREELNARLRASPHWGRRRCRLTAEERAVLAAARGQRFHEILQAGPLPSDAEPLPPGPERRARMWAHGQNVSMRDFTDEEREQMAAERARIQQRRRDNPGRPWSELNP